MMPWMPSVGSSEGGGGGGGGLAGVHVVSFGKTVDVFQSKQMPKKLTVFGDDFRSHAFVIKAGSSGSLSAL